MVSEPVGGAPFWARSQEIRDAILDFRKSGKKTVAYLEYGGEQEYFLATACEKVFLLPSSVLDVKGLATYEVFLRGTFDKIGVAPDFVHIGDYKTAINTFTQRGYAQLDSKVSDINNVGNDGMAGAITAALFLKKFADAPSWMHLDIFAWTSSARPGRPEGGELMAARALYAVLVDRYG